MFELHEFSNHRILDILTLFFMQTTVFVKKLTLIYSISCLSMKVYQSIIDNISPNVDHFPGCGFSNARAYKEVLWAYLPFHPLSHPFDAYKDFQSNVSVNSSGPLIGMLFPSINVNHVSKAWLTIS